MEKLRLGARVRPVGVLQCGRLAEQADEAREWARRAWESWAWWVETGAML